jgi:polyhydroxybutyrate depolymerase
LVGTYIKRLAVFAVAALWPVLAGGEPMQITAAGRTRTFLLERPAAAGPRPTIIALHGFTGTGAQMARYTGLDRLGPGAGFVAVFPDGLRNRWNFYRPGTEPQRTVEDWRPHGGLPDDGAFLKQLIGDLVARGIADPKRIHIVGLSNGSFLTMRLICDEAGLLASVALLVGGMPEALGANCRPARPVPVLMINGSADVVVPYAGGPVQPGGNFSTWPTERLVEFFRQRNECPGSGERSLLPDRTGQRIETARWTECQGAPLAFHRVVGGNHHLPESLELGPLILDFFRDKARDAASRYEPPAMGPIKRVRYRRFDGPTLVTGEVQHGAGGEWIETNTRGSRWTFRLGTETDKAIILHDASRDIYLKIDLASQKLFVARGTQPWAFLADIVAIER